MRQNVGGYDLLAFLERGRRRVLPQYAELELVLMVPDPHYGFSLQTKLRQCCMMSSVQMTSICSRYRLSAASLVKRSSVKFTHSCLHSRTLAQIGRYLPEMRLSYINVALSATGKRTHNQGKFAKRRVIRAKKASASQDRQTKALWPSGNLPPVNDRHAHGEFACGLDLHVTVLAGEQFGRDHPCHRAGVVKRSAVAAVFCLVERLESRASRRRPYRCGCRYVRSASLRFSVVSAL